MVALAMAIAMHFACVTVTALSDTTLASLMLLGCPCKCFSQNYVSIGVLPQKEQTKRESDSNKTTRTERILRTLDHQGYFVR
ncbi:hypothetical protein CCUS01_06605 [Colletotrichum cuscutae]|uniref:Secreted protein n=1 Tax=Colletotrichum cuscutae TaxID=1209917 RepID=A0AAI9V417_9PEZI|nr:hypothetical protein CCUS01_06605 [Colletotrichum cuscutae]